MIKVTLLMFLASLVLAFTPCQPFGPRIFYGSMIQDKSSQEKIIIHFNTIGACNFSYLQVITKAGVEKIDCKTTSLNLSAKVNHYNTSIHKCISKSVNFQEAFYYNAYGWDGSSSNPIPFSSDFIPVKLADITNINRKINLIVLADWSHLDKNKGRYVPLDATLAKVASQKQINGMVIIGDIGYDLDTNNCTNYERFLVMLADVAKSIPIIMVTGNHEYNTADNWNLFVNSFQFYKLDTEWASHLELGSLYLLPFDPYELVLGSGKDVSYNKFAAILTEAKKSNKFIIPTSHYPLACSGTSKNCKNDRTKMKSYWDAMFAAKVSLYLGAHYHTYQRIYPYLANDTFTQQSKDYKAGEPYIISIVEGVAGNDKDIVESIATIQPFTASYTINQTGFAVLEVDTNTVSYTHYSTKQGITDHITISRTAKSSNLITEQ